MDFDKESVWRGCVELGVISAEKSDALIDPFAILDVRD
jgi:hypothetical protein